MIKPVIVSFCAGDEYYFEAAEHLKKRCDELGFQHSIVSIDIEEGTDWAKICRLKSKFYYDKLRELRKPILWIDVDSDIKYIPEFLCSGNVDFSAFYRGFKDVSSFNPIEFARTWAPSFLYFSYSDGGLKLTEEIYKAEQNYQGNATDDYFLEEGWKAIGSEIVALPIPRKFLSVNGDNDDAAFFFGDSGNVKDFKSLVDQHENSKKSNFVAKTILGWIKRSKNINHNKMLFQKVKHLNATDLDILLDLAKIGTSLIPKDALQLAIKAAYLYPRKYESRLLMSNIFIKMGRQKDALDVLKELTLCEYEDWRNLARSKLVDLEREVRAKNLVAQGEKRVKLWWAKTPYPGNWGDILNPYLIEKMTGIPPVFVERGKGTLAIGSVIKWAQNGCHVWGSGTSRRPEKLNPNAIYHSVRGPLTRAEVLRNGGYCPAVYGDPALLLPLFYNPNVKKKYKLGYIPHYQHRAINFPGDAKVIDILSVSDQDIERFINEVLECKYIISSSLHGIIIANAYGIPAQWVTVSQSETQVHGDNTKFDDYFLGAGLPVQKVIDLSEVGSIDSKHFIKKMPKTVNIKFDRDALLSAFPYQELLK
ncbi:polysaccharide pyruvyl transferase family protein [Endozoicomonas sp. 8E]|uniref:polysaccharide pyruvyl transferase family protein n=1 Tax=Endozoicomonas sp. 8E TaxID=3035692 RepID=UPI0029391D9F|nr:polysaccharide pyruvyl transferase family protein [Endozoicomonas sp. 8E]WOG29986.1 polysaccharide pyruvyl transferase family protein [Endozoicomonas sp. 8E]